MITMFKHCAACTGRVYQQKPNTHAMSNNRAFQCLRSQKTKRTPFRSKVQWSNLKYKSYRQASNHRTFEVGCMYCICKGETTGTSCWLLLVSVYPKKPHVRATFAKFRQHFQIINFTTGRSAIFWRTTSIPRSTNYHAP